MRIERGADRRIRRGQPQKEQCPEMAEHAWQYQAYLLRLWWTGQGAQRALRLSLEEPHTGQRHGFATLEHLVAFLEERTETAVRFPDAPPAAGDEG
jgi:hypothetical protein